jgi:hypothetical protein
VISVKKIIAIVVALGAAAFLATKLRANKEDDLWHEATTTR